MNKIVRIRDCFEIILKSGRNYCSSAKLFDDFVLSDYGIKCIDGGYDYEIVDESKFALFMLKLPEHIVEISYE